MPSPRNRRGSQMASVRWTFAALTIATLGLPGCEKKVAPQPNPATSKASTPPSPPPLASTTTASGAASAAASATPSARALLLDVFTTHPSDLRTLDDLPQFLPAGLKRSFVLKHGRDRKGERGHLIETRISQSADPLAPRAILWDDERALFVSYNGGLPEQKNGHRLDVHWWNDADKTFTLEAVDFPLTASASASASGDAGAALLHRSSECASCHGPRSRPIFSMYPDWPGFYGSDNDELTNAKVAVQAAELTDYRKFRREVAPKHPRYRPLFEGGETAQDDEAFPYRPDVREDIHALSRAFAYRPGLRLGISLNRLQARALIEHLTHHPRYEKLGAFFLSHLLQCRSPRAPNAEVEAALGAPIKLVGEGKLLHYRQLWQLFDLEVRDIDIRYSYAHDGYRSDDASKNPMAVGYVGTYWNSYFDGSATIDELVAYGLYEDQVKRVPSLAGLVTPNGLTKKYKHLEERFTLDAKFFAVMDARAQWLSIPYPKSLHDVHHREGFPAEHRKQHDDLCAALK